MITTLRRLFWLALLSGAAYAGWTAWQRQHAPAAAAPEWPPLDPRPTGSKTAGATAAGFVAVDASGGRSNGEAPGEPNASEATTEARWVAPVDGECPEGFPIKANDNSGIYHVPADGSMPAPSPSVATHVRRTRWRTAIVRQSPD